MKTYTTENLYLLSIRTEIMINITNDIWDFEQSPRPMWSTLGKLLATSVMRFIELGTSIIYVSFFLEVFAIVCYTFSMLFHPLVEALDQS